METIEILKEYWSVIVAFVGIIYSYASLKAQNCEQERRIKILEEEVGKLNPIWIEIKERLVAIETTLKILTKDK